MITFKKIINISRPRFWIYVLGTFLVGFIAAGDPRLYSTETLLVLGGLFLFFTFPANILIYGVNDIYDYETDKHNPKKIEYEELVIPKERPFLWKIILISVLPFLLLTFVLPVSAMVVMTVFLFTGVYYSALPIRAKIRPPFDILFSSIIYISPGVIGFFATGNTSISWLAVFGGLLWAMAMQTYSAIPDMGVDTKAGIKTLATLLGQSGAGWFCFVAYLAATIIGYLHLGWFILPLGVTYLCMVLYTIFHPKKSFWMYKKFPMVNTLFGFILFVLLTLNFFI